jgi:hypothetical protein
MRRRSAVLLALPVLLAGLPAVSHSADEPAFTAVQTVAGSIAAPTRFTDGETGYPGLGRRAWLLNPASNGTIMHVFEVDPKTWGGQFRFSQVTDATGAADVDVYFYNDFGTVGGLLASDPGQPRSTAEYAAAGAGGDTGFIPAGSKKGLVFTRNGVNTTFTYQAAAMPRIGLAAGGLDITVPSGAFVSWVNDSGDYASVRRVAANNAFPFDSGSGPASGLRAGEAFTVQTAKTGSFPYKVETASGIRTGTITVVTGPGAGTPAS